MKICFWPSWGGGNKYTDIIVDCLKQLDNSVEILNFSEVNPVQQMRAFLRTEYFHLNWFENLPTNNNVAIAESFLKKMVFCLLLLLLRKKIIFVMHNKQPHETINAFFSSLLTKFLVLCSHKIVVHCSESKDILSNMLRLSCWRRKVVHIPHPNYIGAYPQASQASSGVKDRLKLLFLGAVRPYKNIELLIKVFKEVCGDSVELLIAGRPLNEEYGNKLRKMAEGCNNIRLLFEFVSDEEICNIMAANDILVLPYSISSSLNSGAAILAFSNKKTVICPLIGTIKDLKNKDKVYYYIYLEESEHYFKLKEAISRAQFDFFSDRSSFYDKGLALFNEVALSHSLQKTVEGLKNVYC